MLIVFRLGHKNEKGRGHFNRCLILANLLKKKYQILFFFNKCENAFKKELKKNKFKLIEKKYDLNNEINYLKNLDKSLKIKAVIKDSYFFNLNWEKKINSLFKLIVIDDRLKTSHHADLYINYNYDKNYIKNKINLKFVKKRLIGQKYFITNKNKVPNKRKSKPNFFIYLGSVDSNNFSLKIFNYLKKNYNNKITFLTPQFNTKILSTIQNNRRKNINIINQNQKSISKFLVKNDFIFNSAGTSVYETLFFGKRPVVVHQNQNQKNLCQYLSHKKKIIHLNNVNDLKKLDFKKKYYLLNRNTINSNGKYKIFEEINKLK